jgi:hypothetical protein
VDTCGEIVVAAVIVLLMFAVKRAVWRGDGREDDV